MNKARTGGIRVVDAEGDRLPEFYRIYRETADRAGFLIRAESAYRDVWEAFRPGGRAQLAVRRDRRRRGAGGLFLVRCGGRVVEPYGGMTEAGAESRANYLLKWEAIRRVEGGRAPTTYDLWGLAHPGIAHFKTGFGGREVRFIGAWDLVLDPLGRQTFEVAQRGRVWLARRTRGHPGRGRTGRRGVSGRGVTDPVVIADEPPADWDATAVDRPGGHVLQSVAWAEHRRASGWRPRFVTWREHRVLALTRPWPVVGGSARTSRADRRRWPAARETGVVLWTVANALPRRGRRRASRRTRRSRPTTTATARSSRRRGSTPIEEIQPSRHKVVVDLAGADEAAALANVAKSTRQRIRRAEKDRTRRRPPRRASRGRRGRGVLRAAPSPPPTALDRFYDLLLATGERKHFTFGPREAFVGWWRRAHDAGHLVYLEARDGDPAPAGRPRRAAAVPPWRAAVHGPLRGPRRPRAGAIPGTMHLLRWRAIQLAIREGRHEMDLGGVDVAGARRRPAEGEPMPGCWSTS